MSRVYFSFVSSLIGFIICVGSSTYAKEVVAKSNKTSTIPARRDFPLNTEVSPCNNFYDYVCSKVIDSFQLREDRSHHTFAFNDSAERLLDQKKTFFENLTKSKPETEREQGLKNYYQACMSPFKRSFEEQAEIKKYKKLFSSWKERGEMLAWLERSYLEPESAPLGWGSISNMDHPLKNDLYLTTEYMTLPEKSYYLKDDVMADFKTVVVGFFKALGERDPEAQADVVLNYEKSLAAVTPAPQEFRQIVNNRTFITKADLVKNYPNLKLDILLKEIPDGALIRHWVPDALKFSNDSLSKMSLSDLRSVLLFESLYHIIDDSNKKFYQMKFDFQKKHFGGPNKRPERDERCTRAAMRTFAKEIDAILLPRIFPNFQKEKFVGLVEKVKASIQKSLENNSWLSKDAKKEALLKIQKAKLYLVAPETEKQWDFLPQAVYFSNRPLTNDQTVSKLYKIRSLKEIREESDPGKWDMGPLTVNAYYDASYNKFVMPVGILQYPFYDANLSLEENLGAVGAVIGHELGHSVDDQGARYDWEGHQRQWMSMKDLAEFSKRTELLIGQFDEAKHNGKLTLGENIGDLVGLTSAYNAAMEDPEFAKSPERKKALFVAFGRVWCEVKRPKFIENQLKTDPHSLGSARTNEQMKQQTGFKEAFQCKDSDAMTLPKEKLVRIW